MDAEGAYPETDRLVLRASSRKDQGLCRKLKNPLEARGRVFPSAKEIRVIRLRQDEGSEH